MLLIDPEGAPFPVLKHGEVHIGRSCPLKRSQRDHESACKALFSTCCSGTGEQIGVNDKAPPGERFKLANVGTTGFKRSRAEFGDIFATSPLQNSSSSIGSGTIIKGVKQQFTQGNIASSLNALDLEIGRAHV